MKRSLGFLIAAILFAAWLLADSLWHEPQKVVHLSGKTMGTTYNVTVIGQGIERESLALAIDEQLQSVNASMSNWLDDSEVSLFSASRVVTPVKITDDFARVMAAAMQVHTESLGRFDVTLGPLIELWGFGPRKPGDPVPADAAISSALEHVGQGQLLSLNTESRLLRKSDPFVGVNLSAIAKGYGADQVAAVLHAAGIENYMVEIGGDLVARGVNAQGQPWRIGIEQPALGARTVQLVVPVSNRGLATSGDYRNYFEVDGVRYSHVLDATTGKPITHRTTSVTVLAANAMLADAWATAMLVLGHEAGLKIANERGLAVYFISRGAPGSEQTYITAQSDAFANQLIAE